MSKVVLLTDFEIQVVRGCLNKVKKQSQKKASETLLSKNRNLDSLISAIDKLLNNKLN